MLGNNHRYKGGYSESEVEDMVITEIQDNYDFDSGSYTQEEEDYGDLEYDTEDSEQEESEHTMNDDELGFNKDIEPNLCKDSALGFESKREDSDMNSEKNRSSKANTNQESESRIIFGAIYEIKPSIKYSIVGGKIYFYFDPLTYSPSKDEIERAAAILSLKQRCNGCETERFYTGEFAILYNPTIHSNECVLVCIKFISGVIARYKLGTQD